MKVKVITLAVTTALAAGAMAEANAAYFEPWTVTGSEVTLHIGGSTAQDKGIPLLMRRMCSAGTMTVVNGNKVVALLCEANGTNTPGISAGTKLVVYKESNGGSGNGVKPVANATTLPFINLASLAQTQYQNTATCAFSTTGSTTDFADFEQYDCGSSIAAANVAPDMGLSDVEPELLGYDSTVDGPIAESAGPQVIFGVPVSKNFMMALQTAQGKTPGSYDEAQMPSMTKAQLASIFNGGILGVAQLSDINGNKLTAPAGSALINVCRRKSGSGTLASYKAYFLNVPCAKGTKDMTSGVDGDAIIPAVTSQVQEYGGTAQVIGCLNAMNDANKYAVGMSGMEFHPGSAYSGKSFAAPFDNDEGNWGWVKINGYAPTLLNVPQTRYDFVYEATYQYRATGNSNGALSGASKTLADDIISSNGSKPVIAELNNQFTQPAGTPWYTGLLGKPGSPTAPSAAPAGILTVAEVVANPINTWTRAASGTPNSCQPPRLAGKETGLDMLQ